MTRLLAVLRAALVLLVRRRRLGPVIAGLAGAPVLAFELVEVLAIGPPPGPAFVLQVLNFGIGPGLACLARPSLFDGTEARGRTPRQE